jgi:signal peptidase
MKRFKSLLNIFIGALVILFVVSSLVIGLSAVNIPGFKYKVFTVQSGSMSPAIGTGSVVIVKPLELYGVNDVVTFKTENERDVEHPQYTTTHRIIRIDDRETGSVYITKGDANDGEDYMGVDPSLVVGKVIFHVPFVGYPVSFAKSKEGFILLIIIPGTIIAYSRILDIKNEIVAMIERKKKKKNEKT